MHIVYNNHTTDTLRSNFIAFRDSLLSTFPCDAYINDNIPFTHSLNI